MCLQPLHPLRAAVLPEWGKALLGLSEATCRHTSEIGRQLLDGLADLIRAAQEAPKDSAAWLAGQQAPRLTELWALCECHQQSSSSKLGEFCREMLNDWTAIVRPLLDPRLPLTNNAAERILRHWVIARRIGFGTRSEQGRRALALFASVIDTCRARKASAWDYLDRRHHRWPSAYDYATLACFTGRGE